ncbi:FISUMP domain-containing protein [Parapedobacter sp. 2B3]|uniref:FISUMP domain-containing protein n=1 Tax=Parapedobacter sp. 2B3 TaxID=3342381 RepID=UPI0035B61907
MKAKLAKTIAMMMILGFSGHACKKDSPNGTKKEEKRTEGRKPAVSEDEKAMRVAEVMQDVVGKVVEASIGLKTVGPEALEEAVEVIAAMDDVEDVHVFNGAYLVVTTTGGYRSTLSIRAEDKDGLSLYRGAAGGTAGLIAFAAEEDECSQPIEEKKVLLYSAHHSEFYSENNKEFERNVVDVIKEASDKFEITVLKNAECTVDALRTLNTYGFAILDTHGEFDGILTGTEVRFGGGNGFESVDAFFELLGNAVGAHNAPQFKNGNLRFHYTLNPPELADWSNPKALERLFGHTVTVIVTSKGIREMIPDLNHTILFSNACYSGWMADSYPIYNRYGFPRLDANGDTVRATNIDAVGKAWLSKNPRTFYGYEAATKGISYAVPNEFCKKNEYRLVKSLFDTKDSTGLVHLLFGSVAELPWDSDLFRTDAGALRFKQYASPNWCYTDCGEPFTDPRDGKEYPTVCIGKQVWMAKNLDWTGRGMYFDNDPSKTDGYGRLYTWDQATGGTAFDGNKPVQGGCPLGWHIPSEAEVNELVNFVGGEALAGKKLKARALWEGWQGNSDTFGFSMTPPGDCSTFGGEVDCANEDVFGAIWTSTWDEERDGPKVLFFDDGDGVWTHAYHNDDFEHFSVRCVKDK